MRRRSRIVSGTSPLKASRATARSRPLAIHSQDGIERQVSTIGWASRGWSVAAAKGGRVGEEVQDANDHPEVVARARKQVQAVMARLPEHQREVVLFALATGLRQRNILDLAWDRVDLARRIATIGEGDTKNGEVLGFPLNEIAVAVLDRQQGKHRTHVFTYRGKPLRTAKTRAWRGALKACGTKDFRWHDLRHTWATWLRQNDVPTWVLQELGGWKSESMVRRYGHMSVKRRWWTH